MSAWGSLKFQIATVWYDITRGHNRNIWRALLIAVFGTGVLI